MKDDIFWWQKGPIYQIYPISFYDSDGDGIGDLQGIIEKLDYLNDGTEKSLGVEAIWLSPIYPSPMEDFGYDISDYCNIDPRLGNLEIFKKLIAECKNRNIKVVMDLVANHTSNQHPWFKESASNKDNPKRDWYIWHDAKPDGSVPNNWPSLFGGSGWEWHEPTQQYYLHKFLKEQPDLNLWNLDVQNAILEVMRFWLDLGVAGFRMDVIDLLLEDPTFADAPLNPNYIEGKNSPLLWLQAYWQKETQDIVKKFRKLLNEYQAVGIGEILNGKKLMEFYGTEDDRLQLPFNFSLLYVPWNAESLRDLIDNYDRNLPENCWPNYVFGNHDNPRISSKIGRQNLGSAAMLLFTLRGTPFIYYGEEIGMENISAEELAKRDNKNSPFLRPDYRDPERTPMQWSAQNIHAGFSETNSWIPVSSSYAEINAEKQLLEENSLLTLYRRLIWLRKKYPTLCKGTYRSLFTDNKDCFMYTRQNDEGKFLVVINTGDKEQNIDIDRYNFNGRMICSTANPAGKKNSRTRHIRDIYLSPNEGQLFQIN